MNGKYRYSDMAEKTILHEVGKLKDKTNEHFFVYMYIIRRSSKSVGSLNC